MQIFDKIFVYLFFLLYICSGFGKTADQKADYGNKE